ncbi:phosphatidylinositol 3 and 4-kinase-domain-containing protein [Armillaria novae-zelandiae]|uniref:Phosphatidylinositol 4-kinase n=1 Tax=Armillaria novae-zelandiae TaxID=153914 RepID=A0AA39PKH7_9AGAR|nr:phosphatidylinositol 3 and 4-kinase-domain-containing protein [Armillaria novae-zelandiae]
MSNRAGYQPLVQTVDDEDDIGEGTQVPTSRASGRRRASRSGSIDLHKLDTAFKRWTESIAQRVKRKKTVKEHTKKQIWRSVFEPTIFVDAPPAGLVKTLDHKPPMTAAEFEALVKSVKSAVSEGIHPKMITKGSSGSYFARAKTENGRVHTVAVFKPKDEEPYGRLNPKTTKWLHRQFRFIIPFGRACLIPNLSVLDLHIVPPTKLVSLSSSSFFYDWLDRNAAKKGKQLPDKIGSFQYFLHGYQDASEFLRKYPWPGRAIADTFDDSTHRQGSFSKRLLSAVKVICGKTGDPEDVYEDYEEERLFDATEADPQTPFYWTPSLQHSFREELEKMLFFNSEDVTDYLMLNTDRGADNYMIKYCDVDHEKSLVDVAPSRSATLDMPLMSELRRSPNVPQMETPRSYPSVSMAAASSTAIPGVDYTRYPHIHIAAIDNSLSFPHEHPQGWRSYAYGWLYLPVSVIGKPFSDETRNRFLPLLTSKLWWEETTFELEKLFAIDPDFHPKMFAVRLIVSQLSCCLGQAWNIVQSLKHLDEGPLELTRRTKALVWDDELELTEADLDDATSPVTASPKLSINSVPLPRRARSQSSDDFPPPVQRTISDASGIPRPVPFAAKFQRVHPGTTGVTVLEHLERLDAVEASLQRLNAEEDAEEVDVGEFSTKPIRIPARGQSSGPSASSSQSLPGGAPTSPFSAPGSPLATVHEVPSMASSMTEEDLVAMSMSTPQVEHSRWASQVGRHIDWLQPSEPVAKRTVVVERLETITKKPLCSCW